MVRKQTWILLAVFALTVAAAFLIKEKPALLGFEASPTASPTTQPRMTEGWQSSDIVWIELQDNQGNNLRVLQNASGNWVLDSEEGNAVDAGVVEEVRSQIAAANAIASLDPSFALDVIGLDAPTHILTIRNQQGQQMVIRIGQVTPTGNGYYVKVDDAAPVVVGKNTVDDIVNKLQRDQLIQLETYPTSQP